ncbi:MAG: exodeoxyribonuclease V subunit gamma, partial [Chlamydiia bacterium]|nr:exodeoxyribonuclease V subunit gamma [Chlamydiia bacterium]
MSLNIVLSNRYETLYCELLKGVESDGISSAWIAIDHPVLGDFITDRVIPEGCSVQMTSMEGAFSRLFSRPGMRLITYSEMAIAIHSVLSDYKNTSSCDAYVDAVQSIGGWKSLSPKRREEQLVEFSHCVADLFIAYGLCFSNAPPLTGWQKWLWDEVFQRHPHWSTFGNCSKPLNSSKSCSLHLFAIQSLLPLHWKLIELLQESVSVSLYLFSPCLKYWTDLRSRRSLQAILRHHEREGVSDSQLEDLSLLPEETHPLLSSWGEVSRRQAEIIERESLPFTPIYSLPDSLLKIAHEALPIHDLQFEKSQHSLSLLERLQAELILLHAPGDSEPFTFEERDCSLQIHYAPTPWREVEELKYAIEELISFAQVNGEELALQDILIVVPNLEIYRPALNVHFKESLPISLVFPSALESSLLIQSFWQLLELIDGDSIASECLLLAYAPAFRRRHRFEEEVYEELIRLTEEYRIHWVRDCRKWPSLQYAEEERGSVTVNREELSSLWTVFQSIFEEISSWQPLFLTYAEWGERLVKLFELALTSDSENAREQTEEQWLRTQFEEIGQLESGSSKRVSWQIIAGVLKRRLWSGNSGFKGSDRGIAVGRPHELRGRPAKVIAWLGLNEGSFPRRSYSTALDCTRDLSPAERFPTSEMIDKACFLESFLIARSHLLLFSSTTDPRDGEAVLPSSVIEELSSLLDLRIATENGKKGRECATYRHLLDRSHAPQSVPTRVHSLSQRCAVGAGIFSRDQLEESLQEADRTFPEQGVVRIEALLAAARDLLQVYFLHALGVQLDAEDPVLAEEEAPLDMDPLDRHRIRQRLHLDDFESLLEKAERKKRLPIGPFRTLVVTALKRELEQ